VEAIGDGIRTWINGIPAANLVDFMTPNGFIGLQVHAIKDERTMKVRWKNIRIIDMGLNQEAGELLDPFTGRWESPDKNIRASVYLTPGVNYHANLYSGNSNSKPEILDGKTVDEKVLALRGKAWSGTIENRRLKLEGPPGSVALRRNTHYPPTLNQPPPENAIVLFDGRDLDNWTRHAPKKWLIPDGPALWKIVPGGRLEVVPGKGSIITNRQFGDFRMHMEFRLLGKPTNGGVYLQARYEINIKDSWGQLEGAPCGALGNVSDPQDIPLPGNMAEPPMHWQTYDIVFRAPRFEGPGGKKTEDARITLVFNGKTLYEELALKAVRGAASRLGEAELGPILLQEHGEAYQFRNIWIVENLPDSLTQ
jgi:hypothetical protein